MGALRKACVRFRMTTIVIILIEIAILILFGFHMRYSSYAMPNPYPTASPTAQTMPGENDSNASTASSSPPILLSLPPPLPPLPSLSSSLSSSLSPPISSSSDGSTASSGSSSAPPSGMSSMAMSLIFPTSAIAGNQVAAGDNSTGQTLQRDDNSTGQTLQSTDSTTESTPVPAAVKNAKVTENYAMFEDVHAMMFVGFGFLMTFLKKYGFSSVGFNFLLAAFVLQWSTLTGGYILYWNKQTKKSYIDIISLINGDFACAAVLISFGVVLGKMSPLQYFIMAFIEIVAYEANCLFVYQFLRATDVGCSITVHIFGAFFGLMVSWINYRKETKEAAEKDGSVYQSDVFAMIGTLFLWLLYPSFNAVFAVDEGKLRAIINTYYSLTASCIMSFAISALVTKDKFKMVHIQNSTLAGGVAIGTLADYIIQPWGAILVGGLAGTVSVFGYRFLTPCLAKYLKLHDTCGVINLHGIPGLMSGLGSVLAGGLATKELYGDGLEKLFPAGRSPQELAAYQAAATGTSFGLALVSGAITGAILRIPIWNVPTADEMFDDDMSWELPRDEDDDYTMNGNTTGQFRPSTNQAYQNTLELQDSGRKDDDY